MAVADDTWPRDRVAAVPARRAATVERTTQETDIQVRVDPRPHGTDRRSAPAIGFLDHMLEQVARHGGFALELDLPTATCTSTSITRSRIARSRWARRCARRSGDKRGIGRYGFVSADGRSAGAVAIDLSGRAYHVFEGKFGREPVGELPTELVPHFFRSLADASAQPSTIHVEGENTHHMIEACFKGVGRALRQAVRARRHRNAEQQGRAVSRA